MKCPDRKGLVRSIADFISSNGGNILHADHHIDFETHYFFSRVEWQLDDFTIPSGEIAASFRPLAETYGMEWQLRFSDEQGRDMLPRPAFECEDRNESNRSFR